MLKEVGYFKLAVIWKGSPGSPFLKDKEPEVVCLRMLNTYSFFLVGFIPGFKDRFSNCKHLRKTLQKHILGLCIVEIKLPQTRLGKEL